MKFHAAEARALFCPENWTLLWCHSAAKVCSWQSQCIQEVSGFLSECCWVFYHPAKLPPKSRGSNCPLGTAYGTLSLDLVIIKGQPALRLLLGTRAEGSVGFADLITQAHLGLMVNPIAENNKNWSDLAFSTALIFSLWAAGPLSRCKLQVPCPALPEKHSASRI